MVEKIKDATITPNDHAEPDEADSAEFPMNEDLDAGSTVTDVLVRPNLWEGDSGQLDFPTRKLLALVLKGPAILGSDRPKAWNALLAKRHIIKSRLNDMFLNLVIDEPYRIAFIKQIRMESSFPILLERENLTLIQTALLIVLREHFITADKRQDRAIVDFDQIRAGVRGMRHLTTDFSGFEDRIRSAVAKAVRFGVLRALKAEDHYEITPLIRHVVSAEFVERADAFAVRVKRETAKKQQNADASDEPDSSELDEETADFNNEPMNEARPEESSEFFDFDKE